VAEAAEAAEVEAEAAEEEEEEGSAICWLEARYYWSCCR
jgi:hypothetical protein